MEIAQVKYELIDRLRTLSVYKPNPSNVQHIVRCPYCGDSDNPKNGHFSIKIDVDTDEAIKYKCFKCNNKGVFNRIVLKDLGLEWGDLGNNISALNSSVPKYSSSKFKVVDITIPDIKNDNKIAYINNRIGNHITHDNVVSNKIILSIKSLYIYNNIPIPTTDYELYVFNTLEKYYIGFMSIDNNTIIFRNASNKELLGRYYNYKIYPSNKSASFYTPYTTFDLMTDQIVNVHIAEGVFDILSVYYNMDTNDSIFISVNSYDFTALVKYIIRLGITKIRLHVWSDNDKTDALHNRILQNPVLSIWLEEVYVHRNKYENEKDFGVDISRISEISYRIK